MKEITFKTVDDILEYYGWRDVKKRGGNVNEDGSKRVPGIGEDSQEKRKSPDGEDVL